MINYIFIIILYYFYISIYINKTNKNVKLLQLIVIYNASVICFKDYFRFQLNCDYSFIIFNDKLYINMQIKHYSQMKSPFYMVNTDLFLYINYNY